MHIVTLSFDDGFKKSSLRIAEIYEKFGLAAFLNVIATGHLKTFVPPDEYHVGYPKGDFGLWNELAARGHEIMPHGFRHANKQKLPFEQSTDLITRCLDIFSKELKGFNQSEAIFNYPYNASTPELESWLPTVVKAFRTGGEGINPLPYQGQVKLTCTAYGPENCEHHLDQQIELLLSKPSGWLIYNTHGLNEEGWGPIRSDYLEALLERLLMTPSIRILPVGQALALAEG
jgi:peptidoglycan/xylan/chitin deacetylase (PgdA/CDA1 family)